MTAHLSSLYGLLAEKFRIWLETGHGFISFNTGYNVADNDNGQSAAHPCLASPLPHIETIVGIRDYSAGAAVPPWCAFPSPNLCSPSTHYKPFLVVHITDKMKKFRKIVESSSGQRRVCEFDSIELARSVSHDTLQHSLHPTPVTPASRGPSFLARFKGRRRQGPDGPPIANHPASAGNEGLSPPFQEV